MKHFTSRTSEEEVAMHIDIIKLSRLKPNLLVQLLSETHPIYREKSTNQIVRLRGYILSAFEITGTPKSAIVYILDELENSRSAYLVAAAAKAIRGLELPNSQIASYLFKAIENIKLIDDVISFESYKPSWPQKNTTTALHEIFSTFQWMGSYAKYSVNHIKRLADEECDVFSEAIKIEIGKTLFVIENDSRVFNENCCIPFYESKEINKTFKGHTSETIHLDIELEDQDGNKINYTDFFIKKPTIVAFFYTRCDNPNKCSLTVSKIGQLQKSIVEAGLENHINTAVITYDSNYDFPAKLKNYGESRGLLFNNSNKVFRVTSGFDYLRDYFKLGVSYMQSIVVNHKIELYILNNGSISYSFERLQWNVEDVIHHIKGLNSLNKVSIKLDQKDPNKTGLFQLRTHLNNIAGFSLPILIAFFPKCPICWAAYLSLFGVAGLRSVPYSPWLLPIFCIIMTTNLISLFIYHKTRNGLFPFFISLLGGILLFSFSFINYSQLGLYFGMSLMFMGSLLNSLSLRIYSNVINKISTLNFMIPITRLTNK